MKGRSGMELMSFVVLGVFFFGQDVLGVLIRY
jgi:hypothetical protein